ncbi:GNAT family N-acetyltransferase [Providencia stuartii]|uniref:GNAT family N-acetyltransferase n=2 Tax=Providencia TaxID=586 RepID=A0A1S1HR04_PROST|nr:MULTISPECIES: GNAT family N-acetyltransferase [Providencia]MDV5225654.1 GNAT family N-acetyltransferase [Providencia rettgeri]ELR5041600.1 GNAT family N-acetyltransferase [Providencia stuartii]ELR5080523.1 GNAT family N-acetyltransferase [Providencia stuartii]ELR5111096.1 GNAT family N-acetyltransferase [Providencia stuartii]ELR5298695.1 GNAT family N-acetyltransferase [Providencia stuartii]
MNNNVLPVTVQFVSPDHYAQWLVYWLQYQEFYQVDLKEDITLKTWERFFDKNEPMYCAVALEGDKVLGFVNYLYHRSTWSKNDFCYLEDLFVSPDVRGRQIGKHLIEFVQDQAQKQSCGRLYWHTQETNLRGQRLYDWVAEKPGVIEYRMPL